jgi:hypothetical protein
MPEMIEAIRVALRSMGDGEISISAYDTAWGHDIFFLAQDRIINTLACIIALKSWKIHDDACTKGMIIIEGSCIILGYNSEHQIYIEQRCIVG